MANIQEAIQYAKLNPNTDFATELRRRIESGQMNTELQTAGLNQYIPQTGLDKAKDVAIGAAKGLGRTALDVGQNLQTIGQGAMLAGGVSPETVAKTGFQSLDANSPTGQALEQKLAPTNDMQKYGGYGETAAEVLAGGGAGLIKDAVLGGTKLVSKGAAPVVSKIKQGATALKETIKPTVTQEQFLKDLITPELTGKASVEAIKTGKVTEAGLLGSRDITQAVPGFSNMEKAVSEVPKISPKNTLLENANAIHDHIGTVANDLMTQLKSVQTQVGKDRGFFTPNEFKGYMKSVSQILSDNPTLVGDAEKTANKILTKFNSLVKEKGYTPSGLLEARKALDSWMSLQKGAKVFDPTTENAVSIALRAIRQGGNDFLASKVPDVAVKELLAKQASLYNAIEQIAPKAAKEGVNGLQRWVKANPKLVNLLKLGGASVVGGGTVGVIAN